MRPVRHTMTKTPLIVGLDEPDLAKWTDDEIYDRAWEAVEGAGYLEGVGHDNAILYLGRTEFLSLADRKADDAKGEVSKLYWLRARLSLAGVLVRTPALVEGPSVPGVVRLEAPLADGEAISIWKKGGRAFVRLETSQGEAQTTTASWDVSSAVSELRSELKGSGQ